MSLSRPDVLCLLMFLLLAFQITEISINKEEMAWIETRAGSNLPETGENKNIFIIT